MRRGKTVAAAAALTCAFAVGRDSAAAGFAAARFGGEHGHVTAVNPTALYYNPAGIAFGGGPSGWSLYLDGTLALRQATWEHRLAPSDPPEPPGAEGGTAGKATLSNLLPGPYPAPMLGATLRLGGLAMGVAVLTPFAGRAAWDGNARFANDPNFPLAAGGVQRWFSTTGQLTFTYLTAGVAYRWRRLAVGATVNFIMSRLSNTQARTPTGSGLPDPTREGRAVLDVSGRHGSFGAGLMLELLPRRLWVGAAYQAQPQLGPMSMTGTLRLTAADGMSRVFDVDLHQALPDSVRLGGSLRATDRLQLRLSGELTRWSVMQSQCVGFARQPCQVDITGADATPLGSTIQNLRRRWNDTYGVRGGASLWARPDIELFAGVGFETAAVPDETLSPDLPDAHRVDGALGGRVRLSERLFVAASLTALQFLNRDNSGKSVLPTYLLPTHLPDAGGKYRQRILVFNSNVEYAF